MSALLKLEVNQFRNIESAELALSPTINLIHGNNGSGKTSLLEAIYVLGSGKSFRTTLVEPLIRASASAAILHAENTEGMRIGLLKHRNQKNTLKLNGAVQPNWDEVAHTLPTRILDSGSFQLLESGPKARRRFLDWGVFHVEHRFVDCWRRSRKALANRNRLLKAEPVSESQLKPWDLELAAAGEEMDNSRKRYMNRLIPVFQSFLKDMIEGLPGELMIRYNRGWEDGLPLQQALQQSRVMDSRYGVSQVGPQRADIEIRLGKRKALELLSRGQQKLLVCALQLAQGRLLAETINRQCLFLIDDLSAELDRNNRTKVLDQLINLNSQLFITSVDPNALSFVAPQRAETAMFHMEHGIITN